MRRASRRLRALGLVLAVALPLTVAGCLLPGREGWECSEDGYCVDRYRCRTFRGGGSRKSLCARSNKRSLSSGETYSWFHVIAGWAVIVGLPGGSAIAILVSRARQKAQQARPRPPAAS